MLSMVAQSAINRPIWSHCSRTRRFVHLLWWWGSCSCSWHEFHFRGRAEPICLNSKLESCIKIAFYFQCKSGHLKCIRWFESYFCHCVYFSRKKAQWQFICRQCEQIGRYYATRQLSKTSVNTFAQNRPNFWHLFKLFLKILHLHFSGNYYWHRATFLQTYWSPFLGHSRQQ